MTSEQAVLLVVLLALVLLAVMFFAWRARLRRDAGLSAPLGEPPLDAVVDRVEVLYVATTRHDEPLERLAVSPLTYRARGELALTDRGAALSLDGSPTVFFDSEKLIAADRATVTIDRVVETDGLLRLVWQVADGVVADSYLRLAPSEMVRITAALQPLCAAPESGKNI